MAFYKYISRFNCSRFLRIKLNLNQKWPYHCGNKFGAFELLIYFISRLVLRVDFWGKWNFLNFPKKVLLMKIFTVSFNDFLRDVSIKLKDSNWEKILNTTNSLINNNLNFNFLMEFIYQIQLIRYLFQALITTSKFPFLSYLLVSYSANWPPFNNKAVISIYHFKTSISPFAKQKMRCSSYKLQSAKSTSFR